MTPEQRKMIRQQVIELNRLLREDGGEMSDLKEALKNEGKIKYIDYLHDNKDCVLVQFSRLTSDFSMSITALRKMGFYIGGFKYINRDKVWNVWLNRIGTN